MRISEVDDGLTVVGLTDPVHMEEAGRLYRQVFGYRDPSYGVNPRLLAALAANGGSVVGVLDRAGHVIAFAYGFPGVDDSGHSYHYSQAAVVRDGLQGHGLGRRLKREQARIALMHGAGSMRWAFDPLIARNAHFNLDVLGARARWFRPDYYGEGSDRLVVDWKLGEDTPEAAGLDHADPPAPVMNTAVTHWGIPIELDDQVYLPVPARIDGLRRVDRVAADIVHGRIHAAVPELLARGLVASSCRRVDTGTSIYRFIQDESDRPAPPDREENR